VRGARQQQGGVGDSPPWRDDRGGGDGTGGLVPSQEISTSTRVTTTAPATTAATITTLTTATSSTTTIRTSGKLHHQLL